MFPVEKAETAISDSTDSEDGLSGLAVAGIIAGGAALLAGIGYGVYKAAPHIKNWWNTKVIPFFNKDKDDEED